MKHGRVPIPRKVLEGLEAIRLSGRINMLDAPMVANLASEMGFPETAAWVRDHKNLYAHGILKGFEPEEGPPDARSQIANTTADREGGDEGCADK